MYLCMYMYTILIAITLPSLSYPYEHTHTHSHTHHTQTVMTPKFSEIPSGLRPSSLSSPPMPWRSSLTFSRSSLRSSFPLGVRDSPSLSHMLAVSSISQPLPSSFSRPCWLACYLMGIINWGMRESCPHYWVYTLCYAPPLIRRLSHQLLQRWKFKKYLYPSKI